MKKKTRKRIVQAIVFLTALIILSTLGYLYFANQKESGINIYFFKGEKLVAVERALHSDESPLAQALQDLFAGPSQEEIDQGIITQLPGGIKLLSFKVKQGVAIINLNSRINAYGGGASRVMGMIAQIVYTATELPGIEKVWIWVEGKKEVELGGEGLVLDRPLTRNDAAY